MLREQVPSTGKRSTHAQDSIMHDILQLYENPQSNTSPNRHALRIVMTLQCFAREEQLYREAHINIAEKTFDSTHLMMTVDGSEFSIESI